MPAVAFDVLGTLFSLQRVREALASVGAPAHALELIQALTLHDFVGASLANRYHPLQESLQASIPKALAATGVGSSDRERSAVLESFAQLEPAEGAADACERLHEAGYTLMALTNGGEEQTRSLLERARLAERFAAVVSADHVEQAKPGVAPYIRTREIADDDVWVVASHDWDVFGARSAGLNAVLIASGEARVPEPGPNFVCPDLRAAAERLTASGIIS